MTSKSLRGVDLNLLIVFDAVYATGNISHAAAQLSLTQPAVSNAIQRLREHFDDALFIRAGHGVKPTNRAEQMIQPVREALNLIRQQIEGPGEIDLATYKRMFRIVILDPLEPILMPPLLRLIHREAPGVAIESRPASQAKLIDEIFEGTVDLGVYPFLASTPGLVAKPLCRADHVIVSRRDHPDIKSAPDAAGLLRFGYVGLIHELRAHSNVDRDIAAIAGQRRIVYAVNKIWSIPAVVSETDLIAILPRRFAEHVAKIYDLTIHEPPFPIADQFFYAMWHEKNNDDPGHRWLRETMMAQMAGPQDQSTNAALAAAS